jgi:flavin-dependent thymidylate synthase
VNCELTGHYGGDLTHALSAWTSTLRYLDPERELRIPDLLRMLAKPSENSDQDHGTPFEKSYIGFLVRVDTVTHYQILKHRIGVSANTESARYKELLGESCHVPDDWPLALQQKLEGRFKMAVKDYKAAIAELEPLLGRKRAKESARFFLPLANELTMDVSFNWRSFVAFQSLRNHESAQREINQLAKQMLQLVNDLPGKPFEHSIAAYRNAGKLP